VGRALVHTHAEGITHRDLKPQNVYLLAAGGVKVLDFGVSGLARGPEAGAGGANPSRSTLSLAGTPGYMAPEQWAGAPQDPRTDLWAIGVMLYQLVTGALPFGILRVELGARAPSLPEHVPAALGALVARCLETRPEHRLASARELVDAIVAIRVQL